MSMNDILSKKIRRTALHLASAATLLCGVSAARAADLPDLPPAEPLAVSVDDGWEVKIAPLYGWITGMNGDAAVFGQNPVHIDVTPIDILKNLDTLIDVLDGIYMGAGHIRKGKIGFAWDLVHLGISSTDDIGGDFVGGVLDVGFSVTMATVLSTYRVKQEPNYHIDLVAGARISDVDLTVGVDLRGGGLRSSDGDTWVDPIIGVMGRRSLGERTYVEGWAMVGGFGVSSDFLWDAYGVVGYEAKEWLSLFGGFRAAGTDYSKGSFKWDVTMYGPILGFDLRF
jgi:hypothetical protein